MGICYVTLAYNYIKINFKDDIYYFYRNNDLCGREHKYCILFILENEMFKMINIEIYKDIDYDIDDIKKELNEFLDEHQNKYKLKDYCNDNDKLKLFYDFALVLSNNVLF